MMDSVLSFIPTRLVRSPSAEGSIGEDVVIQNTKTVRVALKRNPGKICSVVSLLLLKRKRRQHQLIKARALR